MKFVIASLIASLAYASTTEKDTNTLTVKGKDYSQQVTFNNPGSTTKCRSVGDLHVTSIEAHLGKGLKIKCYAQWGCAGEPILEITDKKQWKENKLLISCRLCDEKESKKSTLELAKCNGNGGGSGGGGSGGSGGSGGGNGTTPTNSTKVYAATLFSQANYSGMKRWIDGKLGECRGLSSDPIGSIKFVAFPGADPFTSEVSDDVTLAFYDNYGCSGRLVGAVTGAHPNVINLIQNTINSGNTMDMPCDKPSNSTGGGNNTISGPAYSVRFVRTGIDNKFYAMNYAGDETTSQSKSDAEMNVVGYGIMAFGSVAALFM